MDPQLEDSDRVKGDLELVDFVPSGRYLLAKHTPFGQKISKAFDIYDFNSRERARRIELKETFSGQFPGGQPRRQADLFLWSRETAQALGPGQHQNW